jgi:small-conductance mechanosensitive channel
LTKDTGDAGQQRLTATENTTIIVSLFADEVREKGLARQVVGLQLAVALITAGIAYSVDSASQYALATLSGGLVSVLNGAMLAWRMSRPVSHSAHEAHHPGRAHQQLRLMYFYAAERFLVVVVLLGLCMAALRFSPLAVLGGFVMGQAVLLAARLILNRLNKF